MIKICLQIPSYSTVEDMNYTLDSVRGISSSQICIFGDDPAGIETDIPNIQFIAKEDRAELEALLSAWEAEDIIIPIFAGDAFSAAALEKGIEAMEETDHARVFGTDAAYINLIRRGSLNIELFLDLLEQSCMTFADCIADCVETELPAKDVFTEEKISSICWDAHKITFPENKRCVWAFCAGQYSNDFRGNPKYLFLYLNQHRSDIFPYWLCDDEAIIAQVRRMGYCAFRLETQCASVAADHTGVLVSEQVKATLPPGLENAVYLNLWHGVGGVKAVERSLTEGLLAIEIAKKYIQHNTYFRTNEMYLAPSEFIEGIAREQLGLEAHQIIRSGYPRNIYQRVCEPAVTFSHECFRRAELPEDVRFAAYIPTYRNNPKGDLFAAAIPDMDQLIRTCEEQHICMIFKMHPLLEKELSFQQAMLAYADCPWVHFWDNSNDFYEVLDQMDLCIFDYSSMFTDFIAAGCRHYLRYAFDFTADDLDFPLGYDEATLGRKCTSFEALLQALKDYENDDLSSDIRRISDLYWKYSSDDSMDKIADAVLNFQPIRPELPTLYSFDIFDTLISRKVLDPRGIFYRVQEQMRESGARFPADLVKRYPFIRRNAELNMREYYNRTKNERNDERCEIQFNEIMKRIQTLYDLTEKQTALLGKWEIQAELDNVIPLKKTIDRVKQLLANKETVLLVSDMYLPEKVIKQMLAKADPVLATLPLYLSSKRGYQKSAKTLFMEVYRDYAPDYRFGRWVHTGDNLNSDIKNPRFLNIEAVPIHRPEFNDFETAIVEELQSYDAFLIAASMARFREEHPSIEEQFAYAYVSLLFVPYVHWAMRSSKKNGKKNVYFIARDGHHLKRIADVINTAENLKLSTKYLYASRRVWRIPSFFDHIDIGFWGQGYGNLAKVNNFSKLLKALDMDEPTFRRMFPELQSINYETEISSQEIVQLSDIFKNSEKYLHYLLDRAKTQRVATCGYLKQEMDLHKPFSVIEYWGRGYTQENFTRLWQYVCGRKEATTFYYSRSTLPSDADNIRMNYTTHPSSQMFIESIFSSINYKTIQNYQRIDGKWMPVTETLPGNKGLFTALEKYLPMFAEDFCALPMTDRETTGRGLIDFAISWYNEHPEWEGFTKVLAEQVDSIEMYGEKTAFAKALTHEDLDAIVEGTTRAQLSKNIAISYHRSEKDVQQRFREMFQLREGEPLTDGKLITAENIALNQEAVNDLSERKQRQERLQGVYDTAAQANPVQKKILLISRDEEFWEEEYGSIIDALSRQKEYSVEMVCIKGENATNATPLMRKAATASVIITLSPLKPLSHIKLRPETRLIVLGISPIQFFRTGLLRREALRDVKELNDYHLVNDISEIHVPSEIAAERAKKTFSVNAYSRILQTGSVVTDCYFNAELRRRLRTKLDEICPEAAGKKILCYIPLHRYRSPQAKYAYMLDMRLLQRSLGDEWFVIMHLMEASAEMTNIAEIPGFSRNLSDTLSPRVQMLIADAIAADYRDAAFEAPLAGVPTFVTVGDKFNINKKDSMFCLFDEMMYGVPVNNTEELIDQLQNLDQYDDSYRNSFISAYLTACDGKSAERVVSAVLEDQPSGIILPDIGPFGQLPMCSAPDAPIVNVCRDIDGSSTVLYWEPIAGASAYEILCGETEDTCFRPIGRAKEESCVHRIQEDDSAAQWYCVRTVAADGRTCSQCSTAVKKTDLRIQDIQGIPAEPITPQILCAASTPNGYRIYWVGDAQCAGWRVRCHYANGEIETVDHLHVNTWEWTDRDSRANTKTNYTICSLYWSRDGQLIEGPSSSARAPEDKLNLLKGRHANDVLTIKWDAVENAEVYYLYRKNGIRGAYTLIACIDAPAVEYVETFRTAETVSYILTAKTDSAVISLRPAVMGFPTGTLSKPTGLSVTRTDAGNCLCWDSNPDVDYWSIRLCTKENKAGTKIAELPGDQVWWVDTESPADVSYRIEAARRLGRSSQFSGYCAAVSAKNSLMQTAKKYLPEQLKAKLRKE